jgi:hypothetical protein
MPGARRKRKGQTGRRPSAEIRRATGSGGGTVDHYSGRENTRSDKAPRADGRWATPYYEKSPKVISKFNIREVD